MEINDLRNKNARLVLLLLLIGIIDALVFTITSLKTLSYYSIYLAHPIIIFSLWVSIKFLKGTEFKKRSDIILIIVGILYNLGAHLFDLLGTYLYIPDLKTESNPIARLLFDKAGASLSFVYVYGITAKIFGGMVETLLWIGFVGHRYAFIDSISSAKGKGILNYLKAALGGGHQTWRAFFLPLRLRELHRAFHLALLFIVILTSTNIYIWSIWIVPYLDIWFIGLSGLTVFLIVYIIWIIVNYYKTTIPLVK
ncbi:MAG: hypothetical protein V1709_07220 [Planctomycetota bacterium]